jgi:hypothetical protein
LILCALSPVAFAQAPDADWRTIQTAHFRLHYPREYEEWSTRAAERLESIREAVSAEVGFTPPQIIDVIVINPASEPNGIAWPFLDTPRMIFFTEPPGPDEVVGAYGHWIDLLAVHEVTHLVHMLRPARSWKEQLLAKVLPLSPITLGSPRWVLEGYATVVEGRLTGAGRPTSTIRALILRQWAANGRLPTYGQLDSDRRYLGQSMAYLMGSAFLEWLEQRSGPDSLRNLWARITARHERPFDESFAGVFGEKPDRLYGQFVAELTASAMTINRATELRQGELFQETVRASGDPTVSPDGTQLAVVVRRRDEPEKLVIWSTGPATEEEKKYKERIDKILARDPQDVAPIRTKPLPRKAVHTLTMPDGGDISRPRWTRDGKAIVFAHRVPDADGFLHFDLYRWDFENLTRITNLADVRDADPLPDGRTAIALRSRHGASQLVNVDLTNGTVTPRTEASIDVVRVHPRVSPDGTHLAHIAHRAGTWTLVIDDRDIKLPGDAATPDWISNEELVVTLFSRGFAELHRVRLDGTYSQITSTAGGAFEPAAASDGRLFFMSLEPDGYVVRLLPAGTEPLAIRARAADPSLVPAIPPEPRTPAAFAARNVTSRPYGIGKQEFSWFSSQNFAPEQQAIELGVRFGDVIGRFDTLLVGSLARNDAPEGLALASTWRGWPVELHGHAYSVEDRQSCLSPFAPGNDDDGDRQDCLSSTGLELRALWSRRFPQSRLTIEAGALPDDLLFAGAQFTTHQVFGTSRLEESLRVDVDDEHHRAIASLGFGSDAFRLRGTYRYDRGTNVTIGGIPSSILPRSAYAHRVLDPALPVAVLAGDEYDGWRIESSFASLPVTAFYQRHEISATQLSLAGLEVKFSSDPNPILKFPGLDFTAGVARVLDAPDATTVKGDTKWWIGMRWRP